MLFENEGGSYALRQGAVNPPCFLYDINIRDFNNQVQRLSNLRLLDKWWRDKHNIAFRSPEHNKATIINMFFEYQEEQYIKSIQEEFKDPYIPNTGCWVKKPTASNTVSDENVFEDMKKEFDNLMKE